MSSIIVPVITIVIITICAFNGGYFLAGVLFSIIGNIFNIGWLRKPWTTVLIFFLKSLVNYIFVYVLILSLRGSTT